MQAKHFHWFFIFGLVAGSPALTQAAERAGDRISAFAALQFVDDRFGPAAAESIVEMRGRLGQSQPESWDLIVYDRRSPYLTKEFWIGGSKTIDKGVNRDFYPDYIPDGFVTRARLQIDSTAAFRILDSEAARAGVSFDSISYHLRCRELSDEPLWRLTAVDIDGYPVGRVDLSGSTGEIQRTVWYFWDERHRDAPRIVDSALHGGVVIPAVAAPAELGYAPEPRPFSPALAPEPAPAPAPAPLAQAPREEKRGLFGIFSRQPEPEPQPRPRPRTQVPMQNNPPANLQPFVPTPPPGPPVVEVEPVDPPAVPPAPAPPVNAPPTPGTASAPAPVPTLAPAPPVDPNAPMPPELPVDLLPKLPSAPPAAVPGPEPGNSPRPPAAAPRPTINNPEGDPVTVVPIPGGD